MILANSADKKDMEDNTIFNNKVDVALAKKLEWYNNVDLVELLDKYRLIYTCTKNINELLIKKGIIQADPYKLDHRISEIKALDTTPFQDQEASSVLGARLSEYEMMLDFICTYLRFSIENLSSSKLKTLMDINRTFDWNNLTPNNTHSNTRFLAQFINQAKVNAPAVIISTIQDSLDKSRKAIVDICKKLVEINDFQKELYKGKIRKDILESSEFDKQKAYSSPEAEMAEIKRLYSKITGKKNFNTDAVNEIINEDQGQNALVLREKLLQKLGIVEKEVVKANKGPDTKLLLLQAVVSIGALSPIIDSMMVKISDNFELLFYVKKNFFYKLKEAFRKAFGIREKEKECTINVVDTKTGAKSIEKIQINTFLNDLSKKSKIYAGLGAKGPEFSKIANNEEDIILSFLNKQISDNQNLFTIINSLDEHFKANVQVLLKPKIKGLKIDLSSYRNTIIALNKKRGEYVSYKEEETQYKNLGM